MSGKPRGERALTPAERQALRRERRAASEAQMEGALRHIMEAHSIREARRFAETALHLRRPPTRVAE